MYIYIYYMVEIFFSFLNTTTFHFPPPQHVHLPSQRRRLEGTESWKNQTVKAQEILEPSVLQSSMYVHVGS